MIKIENTEVCNWKAAIRGMRNPKNSWHLMDTDFSQDPPAIGPNDLKLMKQLVKAGSDHSKFMRMITVSMDITAPLFYWKEFDTYKVGTVRNSCSTMHKIHAKEFVPEDFSIEHLLPEPSLRVFNKVIEALNVARNCFLEIQEAVTKRNWWYNLIQLLPSSYNQRATITLNYAVLRNMYHARKSHKLDEWRQFCKWVETLPYSELITE